MKQPRSDWRASGQVSAPPKVCHRSPSGRTSFGDKRDVAAMLRICPRTVSNLMSKGLPHIKISSRKCIFNLDDVADWLKGKYGVSRLGKEAVNETKHA